MIYLYFLISFGASIVGAISGIGGGVIIKPVLDSLGSFPVSTISFLAGCTVLSMTTVTLFRNRNSEIVLDKKVSTILAAGGILGGLAGKYIFDSIKQQAGNDAVVGAIQSLLLIIMTFGVLIFTLRKEKINPHHTENVVVTGLIGLLLGGLAAFLGIGGGPINLAVLYFFFSMNPKKAALNSIYIIFFSQLTSLIFTVARGLVPQFDISILFVMIFGGIAGGLAGSMISKKLSHKGVDTLFCGVMIVIIGICMYNFFRYITV